MLVIYNAVLVDADHNSRGYVAVDGTRIAAVSPGDPDADLLEHCSRRIDAGGAMLMPGVIDSHVHLREPGMTHKADIATESRALAAGGVTSWIDMPNVVPPTVTLDALADKQRRAAEKSVNNYAFFVGATADNIDMLARDVDYSRVAGVKAFLGSSTGGLLLNDGKALERLFSSVPALIAVHCEDEDTIAADRQCLMEAYAGNVPVECHPRWRSAQACLRSTTRAVKLARRFGTRLHVLHISTADELNLFSAAPLAEKRITAEACVGHLFFSDDDYTRLGNRIKVNPSIKTKADRDALRRALVEGRIDTVATDHAPHLLGEKKLPYVEAPSGMPMAQFGLVAMLELSLQGLFTPSVIVEKMCHAPAELFGIERRGHLRKGYFADLVLVKRMRRGHALKDSDAASLCRWTPLAGTLLHHHVEMTLVNGAIVYEHRRGIQADNDSRPAMPLTFKR